MTIETFQQFDKNISDALLRPENKLEAMVTELRNATVMQQANQAEMKTQVAGLIKQAESTEVKTSYLDGQRVEMAAKVDIIEQIQEFLTQSDEEFDNLS